MLLLKSLERSEEVALLLQKVRRVVSCVVGQKSDQVFRCWERWGCYLELGSRISVMWIVILLFG